MARYVSLNFAHLETYQPVLSQLGFLAECYFPNDPNTCLIKVRQMAELIARETASRSGLYDNENETQYELLRRLRVNKVLPLVFFEFFDEIRRTGNEANHNLLDDHSTALDCLKKVFALGVWFHRTFHDASFIPSPFSPPKAPEDADDDLVQTLGELRRELETTQTHQKRILRDLEKSQEELRVAKDENSILQNLAREIEQAKSRLEEQLQEQQVQSLNSGINLLEHVVQASLLATNGTSEKRLADKYSARQYPNIDQINISFSKGRLTDEQQAIVAHNEGPALVFAVAGAGKTTALVHRLERLVREKVFDPRKILATSFSKMAVDDLKKSLGRWPHTTGVQVSTLHALGFRIVRKAATEGLIKLKDDRGEGSLEYGLLQRTLKRARDLKVSWADELETLESEDFLSYVGAAKGNLQYADLKAANLPANTVATQAQAPRELEWYLDLYKLFEKVRREEGSLTFDDMLMTGWELLVQHPELLKVTQNAFQAVLVDEFQDVNLAQSEMLDLITPHRNYMAVGDDDQTIYEWRGASPRFILEFERRYNASKYLIRDTFRCPAPQVALAGRVIAHNQNREPKNLSLVKGFEGRVHLRLEPHTPALAQSMVSDIAGLLNEGYKTSDMAVLVRLYAQTPYLEQNLIERQIPYRVVGSSPFYQRPEIQVLLSYLELGLTPPPSVPHLQAGEGYKAHWLRIYNTPKRYLTRALADSIYSQAQKQGLLPALKQALAVAEDRVAKRLQELVDLFEWLGGVIEKSSAFTVLEALESRLEYRRHLMRSSGFYEVGAAKAEGVRAFLDYARDKGNVRQLLAHIEEISQEHLEETKDDSKRLQIMTIFRAKGLEWPLVFIPDCNEGTLPYSGSESVEEERRLFYVALTRSSKHTYLYANSALPISPFLKEAEHLQTLSAVDKVGEALRIRSEELSTAQTLALAQGIYKLGLERFLHNWWQSEEAQTLAAKVLRLFDYAVQKGWLELLGLTPEARAVWEAFDAEIGEAQPEEFADLERFIFKPAETSTSSVAVGQKVRHVQFGTGLVVGLESGVATIAFGDGVRKLALRYARLEPLG